MAAGSIWVASGYVFTKEDGTPTNPEWITRAFRRAALAAGVRPIRLHDLRHTFATLALSADVNPKVVSDILGHASVAFTLDVYSHAVPSLGREATTRIAGIIDREPGRETPSPGPGWL